MPNTIPPAMNTSTINVIFLNNASRLISRGTYSATFDADDIDDNDVGGAAYTSLRLSWRFGDEADSTLLFANVSNLFDRAPPRAPGWGFMGSFHTNEGLFDVLGRRYTVGVRLRR